MAKTKRSLPKNEPAVAPPFNIAPPNDDLHAFGWSMDRMRYPSKDSKPDDVWPGPSIFSVPEAAAFKDLYGFNVEFINAKYLQFMLDCAPGVRKAALRCAAENYSPEALAALRKNILIAFRELIVPDMTKRVQKIAALLADFYAARLAHIETFGAEDADYKDDSTTKSRR